MVYLLVCLLTHLLTIAAHKTGLFNFSGHLLDTKLEQTFPGFYCKRLLALSLIYYFEFFLLPDQD